MQDLVYTRAQTEVSFWGRGEYQPSAQVVADTGLALQQLLTESPRHPDYLNLMARYAAWQAYWSVDPDIREEISRTAMDSQYRALELRPAHQHGWITMVEYASRSRGGESMRQYAQSRLDLLRASARPARLVPEETR